MKTDIDIISLFISLSAAGKRTAKAIRDAIADTVDSSSTNDQAAGAKAANDAIEAAMQKHIEEYHSSD